MENSENKNQPIEGKYGDVFSVVETFKKPLTEEENNKLYDAVDKIVADSVKDIAKLFGVEIAEMRYSLVTDVSSLVLKKVGEHFNIENIMEN